MVMSFTIIYCDIELEHYLQILVNKHGKLAQGMLGVLDMITKITFPTLLINKLILVGSSQWEKNVELNFEVVFLKTIKHALNRLLHGAIQLF